MSDSSEKVEKTRPDPPAVVQKLGSSAEHVRLAALAELLRPEIDPAPVVEAVSGCLDDGSPAVRELATVVLGQAGAPAVRALTHALDPHQTMPVRIAAASGLARIGAPASMAVEPLCRCVEEDDDLLRWHAAFALGKIGAAAVPALRGLLRSERPATVGAALDGLGFIGSDANSAAEDIKGLLPLASPSLRLACHAALVAVTGHIEAGLPMLQAALEEPDASLRKQSLERIGLLRSRAQVLGAAVRRCLDDPAAEVRAAAALALARIEAGDAQAVEGLIGLLEDPELEVRAKAGIGLGGLGPKAAAALPVLQALCGNEDSRLSAIAKAALEKVEGKDGNALPHSPFGNI